MGAYDEYETSGLVCPVCAQEARRWQSKDGPCRHLVFREGHATAVGDACDPGIRSIDLSTFRLRDGELDLCGACGCRSWDARAYVKDGLWHRTRLVHVRSREHHTYSVAEAWSEILPLLAALPGLVVLCPECDAGELEAHDEPVDGRPFRFVRCPACRAFDGVEPNVRPYGSSVPSSESR